MKLSYWLGCMQGSVICPSDQQSKLCTARFISIGQETHLIKIERDYLSESLRQLTVLLCQYFGLLE
jgi:hypothetical protein